MTPGFFYPPRRFRLVEVDRRRIEVQQRPLQQASSPIRTTERIW